VPKAFVAVTVKVYAEPSFSPVIRQLVAGASAVQLAPPGDATAV
jgi:hypothetical protein